MNELYNPINQAFDICNQELKIKKSNESKKNQDDDKKDTVDKLSQKRCLSLDIQQAMYKKKLKNQKKVQDTTQLQSLTDIDQSVIPSEIAQTMKKKSWKTLDNCFKWSLIENYIDSIDEPHKKPNKKDLNILKSLIINRKKEDVTYDKNDNKISLLNYELENKNII